MPMPAAEVPARIEALASMGGLDRATAHSQLAAAIQIIVHLGDGPIRVASSSGWM